ncbi:homoserine O-acetyltransferase/O-succinyltransferase family protein [Macrococcus animalis]|uniref:homoserine O-acetyltransferase/O-succinyltransferase family protein n=1 Tax=Macrococcus animalis TaxID=3395467 RepID=UPI0039BDDF1E
MTLTQTNNNHSRILIVNLMPNKIETELQFKRQFADSHVLIDFLYLKTHQTSTEKQRYVEKHYYNFDEARHLHYDALIVTGAPVEHLPFDSVDYYEELKTVLDWSKNQQQTRLFICWGAQFALHHEYNLIKEPFPNLQKLFGIYEYDVLEKHYLTHGHNTYHIPQSRYTNIDLQDIKQKTDLLILSSHPIFGADILVSKDNKDIYINGHLEYSSNTLHTEYIRDCSRGINITIPKHYYKLNNTNNLVISHWQPFANQFFKRFVTLINAQNCDPHAIYIDHNKNTS